MAALARPAGRPAWLEQLPARRAVALGAVLILALALRAAALAHDLPFSYLGDELHLVKRSMAMGTGDLNPHWFHKPAFLMYLLLGLYGAFYLAGAAAGWFLTVESFGAYFLAGIGPFLLLGRVLVAGFGVGLVWVTYRLGRHLHDSHRAGLAAALAVAVLPPMVGSSAVIGADIPAAFFLAAAVLAYLTLGQRPGLKGMLATGVLAGLSAGMKFYGVALLPVIALAELLRQPGDTRALRAGLRRLLAAGTAFSLAFVLVTPYSLFDPTLRGFLAQMALRFVTPGDRHYDPDSAIEFAYGPETVPAATVALITQMTGWDVLGLTLSILVALGVAACLRDPARRRATLVTLGPVVIFASLAVTLWAYHASPRHLTAVLPLLLVFAWPGALALGRLLGRPKLALPLVLLAALPSTLASLRLVEGMLRPDSRTVASAWIDAHIPRDARLLVDDYGPILPPGPEAVARQRGRLEALPIRDTFTIPDARRIDLLTRHPVTRGFNLDELGHPWWWPHELSDGEIAADALHRRHGNPVKTWQPRPLADYIAAGYGYIITNSSARNRYRNPAAATAYPSFVRFYGELGGLVPLHRIDPAEFGGKGPVVLVYRLPAAAGG